MTSAAHQHVVWSDEVDAIIRGDLTAAAAYGTPAGGAVVTGVAPCGLDRRDDGAVGFTTSLGFGKKLEHIGRDPRVALAYHAREHGYASSPRFVLVQGRAVVDLEPSRTRLDALVPQVEQFLGPVKRGPGWDWLLREYYADRVFVDVVVERIIAWPDLSGSGDPEVFGAPLPGPASVQPPPARGRGPRIDLAKSAGQMSVLPHRVLAYRGADGFPVVVPVDLGGHGDDGLSLVTPPGLLPPGGRRAGLLAHAYRPQLVGLATRTFTGWLEVAGDGRAVYAPHTSKGFMAPPNKHLLLVVNGLLAKASRRRARRTSPSM